mmetsp:Transcript_157640/g.483101  ORF Transcript_157640/g.483101 Transcript_157640/m.483101 type:complete len:518 (+) Transcript_157640:74-1627(+)
MRTGSGGSVGVGFGGPPEAQESPEQKEARERVLKSIREFRMRPRDVKAHLDRFVIEQDDAKKVLSVALCDHYNWTRRCVDDPSMQTANYSKPNILILGPTGSGKTYLVRTMAKMLGVPFVKADATKFSETGIVGEDTEDVIRNLVDSAGGDTELAQYGMVYVDEVDKISGGGGAGSGAWSGRQVQSNFLKIMEETEVSLKNPLQASLGDVLGSRGSKEGRTVSTKFILFIFSGAFNALNDRIKDRVGKQTMGFLVEGEGGDAEGDRPPGARPKGAQSFLHLAETSDFVEAGLEPEFVGRVPVRVAIDALDADDLYRILTEAEDSVLKQYEKEFDGYGIKLKSETAALKRIAELAVEEKTGARALVTVLEKALRDFKFELPSTAVRELVLTEALINDPKGTLNTMLSLPEQAGADLQRWLEEIERKSKVRIDMADEVREKVLEDCGKRSKSAESVLDERFRATGVVDGFKEIYEATDGQVGLFAINMAMYEKPEEEIAKWRRSLEGMEGREATTPGTP